MELYLIDTSRLDPHTLRVCGQLVKEIQYMEYMINMFIIYIHVFTTNFFVFHQEVKV